MGNPFMATHEANTVLKLQLVAPQDGFSDDGLRSIRNLIKLKIRGVALQRGANGNAAMRQNSTLAPLGTRGTAQQRPICRRRRLRVR